MHILFLMKSGSLLQAVVIRFFSFSIIPDIQVPKHWFIIEVIFEISKRIRPYSFFSLSSLSVYGHFFCLCNQSSFFKNQANVFYLFDKWLKLIFKNECVCCIFCIDSLIIAYPYTALLWTAPELLRKIIPTGKRFGSPAGDVYAFAIIAKELICRDKPYSMESHLTDEG